MALINCPECNKEISDKAESCPICGCPINKNQENKNDIIYKRPVKSRFIAFLGIIAILIVLVVILKIKGGKNENPSTYPEKVEATSSPDELSLPNNLSDDEKQLITALQGTWCDTLYNRYFKFIFSGMRVQVYNNNGKISAYEYDLKFVKNGNRKFLIQDREEGSERCHAYAIENNQLVIYTYEGNANYFISCSKHVDLENDRFWLCDKVDDSNTFMSKPKIGMTAVEVENSLWGMPEDINKTTTSSGISEQWVYDNNSYVYIDDGIVTSIQE